MNQRRGRRRGTLDFPNPVDLIVEGVVWQLRWAGRRIITGAVLVAGLIVMSAAVFVPLILAALLITVFGLPVEPYKWVGTILIVVAFVVGVVAAPLILIRVIRRGRRLIGLTEFGAADAAGPSELGPTPIVPPGSTRELWSSRIRVMDEHLASPPDPARPASRRSD